MQLYACFWKGLLLKKINCRKTQRSEHNQSVSKTAHKHKAEEVTHSCTPKAITFITLWEAWVHVCKGWTLPKFTQMKRNKKFDNFIMLVWVHGSPVHIAARSHPVQEAWGGHKIVYTGVKIKKLLQCCREPYQQIPLVIKIQKKIVWPIYDVPFRSYWRKGRRSNFWLYRDQTGKNDPTLLAMVSKCSSSKYNEKSE